jgi:hypothetical protein
MKFRLSRLSLYHVRASTEMGGAAARSGSPWRRSHSSCTSCEKPAITASAYPIARLAVLSSVASTIACTVTPPPVQSRREKSGGTTTASFARPASTAAVTSA